MCEGKGFAFDIEVLALAQLLELRIVEVPIRWVDVSGSSVRMVRDPLFMLRDVMRTRQRCLRIEKQFGRRVQQSPQPDAKIDMQLLEMINAQRANGHVASNGDDAG